MENILKIEYITYFMDGSYGMSKEDIVAFNETATPQCDEFSGDYSGVELFINGKSVVEYGDYYHDKGDYKVDGFIDGIKFATGMDVDIKRVSKLRDY